MKPDPAAGIVCAEPKDDLKVDCQMALWGPWEECHITGKCGEGQKQRTRAMTPPAHGGATCDSDTTQTQGCTSPSGALDEGCGQNEVDCAWGEWSAWNSCTKCGEQVTRTKIVSTLPTSGGKGCGFESTVQTMLCEGEDVCGEIYCGWGDWHAWEPCSVTCGFAGFKKRSRQLTLSASPGGTHDEYDVGRTRTPMNIAALGPSGLYEVAALRKKYEDLQQGTQQVEVRHTQDLVVAFSCGMVSFMAIFGVISLWKRSRSAVVSPSNYATVPLNGGGEVLLSSVE